MGVFFAHQHSWESGAEWQVNMDSYRAWCCLHDVTPTLYILHILCAHQHGV